MQVFIRKTILSSLRWVHKKSLKNLGGLIISLYFCGMDRDDELFFALVRAGMMGERLAVQVPDDAWTWLYEMAARQSVLGVCYQPQASMPKELAIRWAAMVETIAGLNRLQYHEAAIQTANFSAAGCQSAILKGQANARLYPNKFVRQPGDVDIWVEGGRKHVMAVLGMHLSTQQQKGTLSYDQRAGARHHPRIASGNVHFLTFFDISVIF